MRTRGIIITTIIFSFFLLSLNSTSQDIIAKTNGDVIEAKVIEITPEIVKYYKFTRLEGPVYTLYIKDVSMIKYPDGSQDVFESKQDRMKAKNEILTDTIIDERDGREYSTVKIGEQWWMAENLKYKNENSVCNKKHDSECVECGQYYIFEEAIDACPDGWHLPSDDEWKKLERTAGMDNLEVGKGGWRGTARGQAPKLLVGGTTGLEIRFCGAIINMASYRFYKEAFYWTATRKNKLNAWARHFKQRASIDRNYSPKYYRYNIRCIKDNE